MRKRTAAIILAVSIGLLSLSPLTAAAITASPTASAVIVDGTKVAFDAYNIEGNNYFKVRDLAYALSGTAKQFDVGWDAANNAISLTSGKAYTVSGGEMSGKGKSSKTPTPTTARVFLDGKEIKFTAYNIADNNYFKLRDIAQALNFSAEWDAERNAIVIDTGKSYTQEPPLTLLAETEDMGQTYIDSIVFLGDSTTYGLRAYGVLAGGNQTTQVWTPENGTFSLFNQSSILIYYPETGSNITVEKAVSSKKPEYMVITLGVNGVAMMDEEYFTSEYKALLDRIIDANPDTKIILNSIYPVARNYNLLKQINNEKIDTANEWVYAIAEEMELRYLDTSSMLKDEEGWLPASYQNGDGMHLTAEAFKLVLSYIRTHGYK